MDVTQQVAYRRKHVAIPLQFDDDQLVGPVVMVCLEIVKADVKVDGQTFGLPPVHQRHSVELISDHSLQPVQIQPCFPLHQLMRALRFTEIVL